MGGNISDQVILGCIRKQAYCKQNKPFSPQVAFDCGVLSHQPRAN